MVAYCSLTVVRVLLTDLALLVRGLRISSLEFRGRFSGHFQHEVVAYCSYLVLLSLTMVVSSYLVLQIHELAHFSKISSSAHALVDTSRTGELWPTVLLLFGALI